MINSLKESFYQRVLYDLSSFYLLLIYLQAAQRFDKNEIIFVVLYPTLFYCMNIETHARYKWNKYSIIESMKMISHVQFIYLKFL